MYECVYGAGGDRQRIFAASGVTGTCELPYEVQGTEPRHPTRAAYTLSHLAISTVSRVTLVKSTRALKQVSPGWWSWGRCVIIWDLA